MFTFDLDSFDDEVRSCYQRALASRVLADETSPEAQKLQKAAQYYGESARFIQEMIDLLPEGMLMPEIQIWLHDTEALQFHCLGDYAYFVAQNYDDYIEYHDKSAGARKQALRLIPADDKAFEGLMLFHLGRMFYVMGDAQDGRAILLEKAGKWKEAARAREEERDLKQKEFECLQQVVPPNAARHHLGRFWSAERSRLLCLVKQAELDGDYQQKLEHLQDALEAAEQARQATPDWPPYTQICRQLQREIDLLLGDHPELAEAESIQALMIRSLGRGMDHDRESLEEIIASLDAVAAKKRQHLIPRCFKIGAPFCPYRLEEMEDLVFVGMPFRPEYENVFRFAVEPSLAELSLKPWKANEVISNIDMMCKMCSAIQQSSFAIVNISEWNPNVMFELGLLYAMHKHVLLIKDSKHNVPVDLSGMEYVEYSRFDRLRESIYDYFTKILQEGSGAARKCFKLGILECPMDVERDPLRVFIAMPFRHEQENLYQYALKPAVERAGLRTWKADEDLQNVDIMCKTCQSIQRSPYGVADVTGWNPNVMFELGLLYGYGQKVVLLKQKNGEVPVDLQGLEYIEYDDYITLSKKVERYLSIVSR